MAAAAAANSSECIAAGSCKPLGGYSVWAAVPPLPLHHSSGGGTGLPTAAAGNAAASSSSSSSNSSSHSHNSDLPIILLVAQMDSIDMFHDAIQVGHHLWCLNYMYGYAS